MCSGGFERDSRRVRAEGNILSSAFDCPDVVLGMETYCAKLQYPTLTGNEMCHVPLGLIDTVLTRKAFACKADAQLEPLCWSTTHGDASVGRLEHVLPRYVDVAECCTL